eukprot:XP_025013075.1 soluble inorganic pyrophosphatase 6, chloroplastic isoform X2 [Ricinus communis]
MEVATNEPFNATKQDTKKVQLRSYPYNINWNYGLLLQTWEDPSFANTEVEGALGDNDPEIINFWIETGKQVWSWKQGSEQGLCFEGHQ